VTGLPIVGGKTPMRSSKMTRRRAAVLIGVHVLAAIHIVHWRLTGSTLTPVEPSEAMEFAKHSVVNAGLIFFAATILLTALFGRFFCGWGCHLVALQDLSRSLLLKVGIRPRPLRSRLLALVPLIAFVYMFLWPLAYRLWIGESLGPTRSELFTATFWETFPGWVLALVTFFVCGFVAVYFLGAKGFCNYACPYGGIFAVADRVAPVAIRVTDACEQCGHCTATCTSNVRVHEEVHVFGRVVDSGCMKCLDCVSVCPNDALHVGWGAPALATGTRAGRSRPSHRPAFSRGEELLLAVSFLLTFVVFRGLYQAFPFLFSLGLSAVISYLTLQTYRLFALERLRLQKVTLKSGGSIRPAGWGFLALMALVTGFWAHSALVRYHGLRGDRLYGETLELTAATIERGAPPTLSLADRQKVEAAAHHLDFVDRWALRSSAEVDIRLAWLSQLAGRPAAFEAHATAALSAAPRNTTMRLELGDYYLHRGDRERAAELYKEVLAIDPGASEAAVNLGALYASRRRFEDARAVFERGLGASPDSSKLNYNLAMAQLALGESDSAVASFESALELEPDFLEARENLAGYLCSLGRFEEGLTHYRTALEQAPDDAATHLLAARAYEGAGDLESAQAEAREALRLNPAIPGGDQLLARLLAR
jgi:tetratricopeptide (TPR) repeat protein